MYAHITNYRKVSRKHTQLRKMINIIKAILDTILKKLYTNG